jgi:hypothetical protein
MLGKSMSLNIMSKKEKHMKKRAMLFIILILLCAAAFSQEESSSYLTQEIINSLNLIQMNKDFLMPVLDMIFSNE